MTYKHTHVKYKQTRDSPFVHGIAEALANVRGYRAVLGQLSHVLQHDVDVIFIA